MKKIIALLLVLVMALSLVACGNDTPTTSSSVPTSTNPSQEQPKVGADFTVTVTDLDGTKNTFTYHSEAKTVGEALLAEGLIAGDQSDWGLMVTTVNGITADWATENAYWAFYINGEYAQTGVDATELVDGATYAFVKTWLLIMCISTVTFALFNGTIMLMTITTTDSMKDLNTIIWVQNAVNTVVSVVFVWLSYYLFKRMTVIPRKFF